MLHMLVMHRYIGYISTWAGPCSSESHGSFHTDCMKKRLRLQRLELNAERQKVVLICIMLQNPMPWINVHWVHLSVGKI